MQILRVATAYEPDLRLLPDEFRSVLTRQDRDAIRNGPEFFSRLSAEAKPRWLRLLLQKYAETGWELQFSVWGNDPFRPYFRDLWGYGPALGLPRKKPLRRDLPPFLRDVYGVAGSLRLNGFDEAGGLCAADGIGPVSETGIWIEPDGSIDPSTAVFFLDNEAGSQLCYLPDGTGAWLEAGKFRRVRGLEREVARYFGELLG
jgi:hypothetical protein